MTPIRKRPTRATLSRRKRRQNSCHGVRPSMPATTAAGASTSRLRRACPSVATLPTCREPVSSGAEAFRGAAPDGHRDYTARACPGGGWPVQAHEDGLSPARAPRRAGRMSTPRRAPSDPVAHARSPKALEPSEGTPPPETRSGTGSAVWRLADARGRVVRRDGHHRVRGYRAVGSTSPKNARSISAITSRLSNARPSCAGHVGPLDVDVERVVAAERLGGELRPRAT